MAEVYFVPFCAQRAGLPSDKAQVAVGADICINAVCTILKMHPAQRVGCMSCALVWSRIAGSGDSGFMGILGST